MKIMTLSPERRQLASEVLRAYSGFQKESQPGSPLSSTVHPEQPSTSQQQLLDLLASEQPAKQAFSAGQVRQLTLIVDFMAVALPDQNSYLWRDETLQLASFLRKSFTKSFGGSVYD